MSSLTMRLSFSPAPVKASPALRKSDAVDTGKCHTNSQPVVIQRRNDASYYTRPHLNHARDSTLMINILLTF